MKTTSDFSSQVASDLQILIPRIAEGSVLEDISAECRYLIVASLLELLDKQRWTVDCLSEMTGETDITPPVMIAIEKKQFVEIKGKQSEEWITTKAEFVSPEQTFRIYTDDGLVIAKAAFFKDELLHGRVLNNG